MLAAEEGSGKGTKRAELGPSRGRVAILWEKFTSPTQPSCLLERGPVAPSGFCPLLPP